MEHTFEDYIYDTGYGEVAGNYIVEYKISGGEIIIETVSFYWMDSTTERENEDEDINISDKLEQRFVEQILEYR